MGADAVVIRHGASGAPYRLATSGWIDGAVVNAGDGTHEHPTQALLDAFTMRRRLVGRGRRDRPGPRRHAGSRSSATSCTAGSPAPTSTCCTPSAPRSPWSPRPPWCRSASRPGPARSRTTSTSVLPKSDAVMMLRVQRERMNAAFFPTEREYSRRYGLDGDRMARMPEHAIVMHPGPMIRGMEITAEVADSDRCTVVEQVANGVSIRMAVLYLLLGGNEPAVSPHPARTEEKQVTMSKILIRGAKVLGGEPQDVLIDGETIAAVGTGLSRRGRRRSSRPTGRILLPGLVDLHTHLREPGREDSETVLTGTRAAAVGGFTAVHAMANTFPVADTAGVVEQVWRLGKESGYCDVQPVGAVTVGLEGKQARRARRHARLRRRRHGLLRRRQVRRRRRDHAPRPGVREGLRRRRRPARPGAAADRGRPDERGRRLRRARPRRLARRRRGVDHRPRRAARRARRLPRPHLPPVHRRAPSRSSAGPSPRAGTSPPRSPRTTCSSPTSWSARTTRSTR